MTKFLLIYIILVAAYGSLTSDKNHFNTRRFSYRGFD